MPNHGVPAGDADRKLRRGGRGRRVTIGGQDCHALAAGAHTGDISAEMLRDAGAAAVIVGHSERRRIMAKPMRMVRAKALAAHRAGLHRYCLRRGDPGRTRSRAARHVVRRQLDGSLPDDRRGSVDRL